MYFYSVSTGTPEGIDYSMDLYHEQEFSQEDFEIIVEQGFLDFLKKEPESSVFESSEFMLDYMTNKGFKPVEETARYFLEPYWSSGRVKNPELKALIKKR